VNPKLVVANEFRVLINECVGHTHTYKPKNFTTTVICVCDPETGRLR